MDAAKGPTRGELTADERSELAKIRAQLEDASKTVSKLLGGWNHGPKEEYRQIQDVAKAVAEARDAAKRLT